MMAIVENQPSALQETTGGLTQQLLAQIMTYVTPMPMVPIIIALQHGGGTAFNWWVSLPSTGLYEIEVHVPQWDLTNRTHAARYTVSFPTGQTNVVTVDQAQIDQDTWISLGRYTFNSGQQLGQYVHVMDNSKIGGFIDLTSRKVLVDSVRIVKSH